MSSDSSQVYLDHLVPRMNLRYRRSDEVLPSRPRGGQPEDLPMSDLGPGEFRPSILRKPDFQRATNAWSPEDCVALLESVVNRQVIPSVIMWYSPNLDEIRKAAMEVRRLVSIRIGSIDDYVRSSEDFDAIIRTNGAPGQEMNEADFKRALFYNDFRRRAIKFEVQWVEGSYEIAEKSFIKINKSGRQLSVWETKLIENRDSSFARAIMSISSPDNLQYYWPASVPSQAEKQDISQKVAFIREGISQITNILFDPPYTPNHIQLKQPLMTLFGQDSDKKPYWIAEVLTVAQRGSGTSGETEKLLAKDSAGSTEELINNGYALVTKTLDTFEHLIGRTPLALGIVPSLYFYTRSVRYVRSLLYGFTYWLLSGSDQDILLRKRLFCSHRRTFEQVLLEYRDEFASGLGRKSGSGSEVTVQTARYYQEVLQLLIEHNDEIASDSFVKGYNNVLSKKFEIQRRASTSRSNRSRIFTNRQKAAKRMEVLLDSAPRCEICGGIFDPSLPHGYSQHDHRIEVFKGGQTIENNQRLVHNFCNNQANREFIEDIVSTKRKIQLPYFADDIESFSGSFQLRLLEDEHFSYSSEIDE
ncbi:MAG: HNH endonuclease [Caldilineaceae bacterium]|nr:HNH endonuclease [Caldilineaceae bacterium]